VREMLADERLFVPARREKTVRVKAFREP
jgi:hypothetical protein